MAKRFLDTVIDDEHLYGRIVNVPTQLAKYKHWSAHFLLALLNLYAKKFEEALKAINQVMALHNCYEAMYVKVRILTKLKRYTEADAVITNIVEDFDMSTPDVKLLYLGGVFNEMYTFDRGLHLLQKVVELAPEYDKGILTLRTLMHRKRIKLTGSEDISEELIKAFDSDLNPTDFHSLLTEKKKEKSPEIKILYKKITAFTFD